MKGTKCVPDLLGAILITVAGNRIAGIGRVDPVVVDFNEIDVTIDKPDHVFELHPVTRTNGIELLDSFKPVKGFSPGGAQRTFGIYEKVSCTLTVKPKTVSILTATGLYNDVEFIMEVADDQQLVVPDGRFVTAAARDLDGGVLVERLRMVFVKGTPPERAVSRLKRGDRLHVYGMPRLDLAEISRRVRDSGMTPALLTKSLPYEIIILGVYASEK